MIEKVVKTDYPLVDAYNIPEELRRGRRVVGQCPRCGKPVIEGNFGYGCTGYKEGCKFVIWKTAKSGMFSKTEITPEMAHELLSSEWIDETPKADEQSTSKKRTKNTIELRKLYSEAKKKYFSGKVYLVDEGKNSEYGASFGIESFINEAPQSLGKCPRCGKDIIEGKMAFGCSGYKDGCRFAIWKQSKQRLLSNVTFTESDAKKLLKGKTVKKSKLLDVHNIEFKADLVMIEEADNPYGPIFKVVKGSIEAKDVAPEKIVTETVEL